MLGNEARTRAVQDRERCSAVKEMLEKQDLIAWRAGEPSCSPGPAGDGGRRASSPGEGERGQKDTVQRGTIPCPCCFHRNINNFFAVSGEAVCSHFIFFSSGIFLYLPARNYLFFLINNLKKWRTDSGRQRAGSGRQPERCPGAGRLRGAVRGARGPARLLRPACAGAAPRIPGWRAAPLRSPPLGSAGLRRHGGGGPGTRSPAGGMRGGRERESAERARC